MMIKRLFNVFVIMITLASSAFAQSAIDGMQAVQVEKYAKAKSIFQSLIEKTPTDAPNYYFLGDIYLLNEDEDSAKIFFDKGIAANPLHPYSYIGLGKIELKKGNDAGAKANFEKAVTLGGAKDFFTLLYIGEAYAKKNFTEALIYLNRALKLNPKSPELFIAIGDVYLEKDMGTEAILNYDKAFAINKNLPKVNLRIGQVYKRALNYDASQESIEKAIAIDSNYSPAYRELGELYYSRGKYDKAIENYKKYVDMTDNSFDTRARYASFLFLSKDYKASAEEINNLMKADSSKFVLYRLLAYSDFETGDFASGLVAMEKFFAKAPESKVLGSDYEYLGKLQIKSGKDSLGIKSLEKAITLDTTKLDSYTELGAAYYKMKKFDESSKAYQKKVDAKKATAIDYFYYGRSLYLNNEFEKSDSAFATLSRSQPNFPTAYLYRARINSNMDKDSKQGLAKPFYEKFIELTPIDPANAAKNKKELVEANSYLGYYYFLQKNNSQSKVFWQKVKELDPTNQQATDVLKQL